MNGPTVYVPWTATCSGCGREYKAHAPADDGGQGHYTRCGGCRTINHSSERLPYEHGDVEESGAA